MSSKKHHAEWLSLVEVSGPFLSVPVLEKVFPQGLDAHDPEQFRTLRLAYEEWEENQTGYRPNAAIHSAWINYVLKQTLGLPDEVLAEGQAIPQTLKVTISEHGETLRPDYLVRNPADDVKDASKPRLLVQVYPLEQNLEKPVAGRHWKASPATRMMELLHATDVRLGLVTNGEHWMLVDAPRGETTGFASWYASLWLEEQITLRAFRSLLGVQRFFSVPEDETLEAMLAESATHQQEVTDQLGLQVRNAVEILIQSLDRADQDHGRELLGDVPEAVLYEAALTVMMRLVFLFSAEERELLLLGDPLYDQHYAVSTLVAQLQEAADQHGEEVVERRLDAWVRLLSTFRAVYSGVQHERMKLPAYAGNLFNPDRFRFLEGRKPGTTWQNTPATPLPVNNRTVLHLLRSLQYLELQGEARRLSFRALDIEQIGHVYEGLLDHTAKRATEPVLGLFGAKGKEPEIALAELEKQRAKGEDALVKFLKDETGRSESALRRALEPTLETADANRLRAACGNDEKLFERVRPFSSLIRTDSFDRPVVVRKGSVYVTSGTDRRTSGTHYTPKSLTEPIVQHTLEPLVYVGPAEGKPKEEWKLRPARELLDLKICDMACGSGAFLVQACRYLSELLVEAWEQAEAEHPGEPGITPEGHASTGAAGEQLIPKETDERLTYARRTVAQRCLYGVDKNPLAVEMAKLSLWLLTLAKDKPFTFLDHAIRCGDSLVGISSIDQLLHFSLTENVSTGPLLEQQRQQIEKRLNATKMLRRQIEEMPSNTPQDVERKALMLKNADEQTRRLTYAADLLLAASWEPMSDSERESALNAMLVEAADRFKELPVEQLDTEAKKRLGEVGMEGRFHWPLEFPEVFMDRGGFDAYVGNPPFLGGSRISGILGDGYLDYLLTQYPRTSGNGDLVAFFLRRASQLTRSTGILGLITTNSVSQGTTREGSLDYLVSHSHRIINARKSYRWPGTANVFVSVIHISRNGWAGNCLLDGQPVDSITSYLDPGADDFLPYRLPSNLHTVFRGSTISGEGFILSLHEYEQLTAADPASVDVIKPFLTGRDINQDPNQKSARFAIDLGDRDERSARQYKACWNRLYETVRLQRQGNKIRQREEVWWQYIGRQEALYEAIATYSRVLVCGQVSKYWGASWVATGQVFADKVVVFALQDDAHFATLNSCFHTEWADKTSSRLKEDPNYNLAKTFETFALPTVTGDCNDVGRRVHEQRVRVMQSHQYGLTDTYNRFHNPEETAADIHKLRDLHIEMDKVVAAAYGWGDLDLGHDFHPTKQGVRFTISEPARREVLRRLLKLNHERYAEEVKQGLHDKKKGKAKKTNTGKGRKKQVSSGPMLFGDDDDEGG